MTDALLSDREWIAVNPARQYRIVRRGAPDSAGLIYVDLTSIGVDRNIWSRQRVIMRAELPDTDAAALLTLEERNTITARQVSH